MTDIVVPYFRAGLEANELCVWVTSDFLTTDDALAAMQVGVPGFTEYRAGKQFEVFPYTDWYLKGGSFDLRRTLDMWMAKHDEALARGFAGLRVTGNPYWIDNKKDWDDFAAYEAEITKVIRGTKLLVLCTYSLQKCGVAEILDVVKNHEFAVAMNQGTWQVVTMPVPTGRTQPAARSRRERGRRPAREVTHGANPPAAVGHRVRRRPPVGQPLLRVPRVGAGAARRPRPVRAGRARGARAVRVGGPSPAHGGRGGGGARARRPGLRPVRRARPARDRRRSGSARAPGAARGRR